MWIVACHLASLRLFPYLGNKNNGILHGCWEKQMKREMDYDRIYKLLFKSWLCGNSLVIFKNWQDGYGLNLSYFFIYIWIILL